MVDGIEDGSLMKSDNLGIFHKNGSCPVGSYLFSLLITIDYPEKNGRLS